MRATYPYLCVYVLAQVFHCVCALLFMCVEKEMIVRTVFLRDEAALDPVGVRYFVNTKNRCKAVN